MDYTLENLNIGKAGEMLKVAFDHWQDDYTVKSVAEPFSVTLPGVERPLIGEFDLVVEEGGKDPCIVDWKTSGSRWPTGKADFEHQATAYCYAYRARYRRNARRQPARCQQLGCPTPAGRGRDRALQSASYPSSARSHPLPPRRTLPH